MSDSQTFTYEQVCNYLAGWFISSANSNALSFNEIVAAMSNALSQIECDQDGLAAVVKRDSMPETRIEPFVKICGGTFIQ